VLPGRRAYNSTLHAFYCPLAQIVNRALRFVNSPFFLSVEWELGLVVLAPKGFEGLSFWCKIASDNLMLSDAILLMMMSASKADTLPVVYLWFRFSFIFFAYPFDSTYLLSNITPLVV
jgi:hypothetical protein